MKGALTGTLHRGPANPSDQSARTIMQKPQERNSLKSGQDKTSLAHGRLQDCSTSATNLS